jgi:hypothetical protein
LLEENELLLTASHGAMRADVQGFCKFKVASRTDIFILQKTKKHISLKKRFGRQCFISRTAQACQTLAGIVNGQQDNENARQENSST